MKISELIVKLQEKLAVSGDAEIAINDSRGLYPLTEVKYSSDYKPYLDRKKVDPKRKEYETGDKAPKHLYCLLHKDSYAFVL